VQEDIAVGMSAKAFAVGKRDPADLQRNIGPELVGVPAEANPGSGFHTWF